jgi:hypothetical protein
LRRTVAVLAAPLLGLVTLALPAAAETTRTLQLKLSGDSAQPFAVENLVGSMKLASGPGDEVVAVATIHAESPELAKLVRFEQVPGKKGVPTLRVRYPLDRYRTYRYGQSKTGGEGFLEWLTGGTDKVEYDGARVSISGGSGVVLYADVVVQVPKRTIDGFFRNVAGPISGEGLNGKATLDTGSGDVSVRDSRGEVVADTGSGNVKADGIKGSFSCDTGSGTCDVAGFDGETLVCDTGSGKVTIASATAHRIAVDTGSGDVRVTEADTEEFTADTGSGDIRLEATGSRLTKLKADTGSGDVTLRLAADAGFEVRANMSSGDLVSRFADAQSIVRGREVVGYRRGDARTRIAVDTGSGDVVIEPLR